MSRRRALTAGLVGSVLALGVPASQAVPTVPHVLVYDQTLGFHHQSVEVAEQRLKELALDGPFTIEITKDPKAFSKKALARTDIVMWLSNTAADGRGSPFTDAQEKAYADWMLCGGGHVGVHAAVDSYDDKAFPAYVEANGAIFTKHGWTPTAGLDDLDHENEGSGEPEHTLRVVDPRSPITAMWQGDFTWQDELYQLDRDPRKTVTDYRLLLSHEGVTDPQGMVTTPVTGAYAEHAPIAWTGSYRHKNRTFYTNLGHGVKTWRDADFVQHLLAGVKWVSQRQVDRSCLRSKGIA